MRCARTLGISYKRWLGWQPTDDDPTEWDETERTWMRALYEYEHGVLCPLCGMPLDYCHDEAKVRADYSDVDIETCFVSELRERSMKRFADSGEIPYPGSLTTKLLPAPRE